jgi:putative DNA primase/helicase
MLNMIKYPGRGGARHGVRNATSKARNSRCSCSTKKLDFEAINCAALLVLPILLAQWLPTGKRVGREYVALNPRRDDRHFGSFKIAISGRRVGMWADFSTGDEGGDVISLAAYLFELSQGEAARRVADMVGLDVTRIGVCEVSEKRSLPKADESVKRRIERAVMLWRQGTDPRGTLVETYLASRALALAPELATRVIRFHATCPWRDKVSGELMHIPAMLTVMRSIYTNEVIAVQRTALSQTGKKIGRMALGRKTGAAIKLSADEDVTMRLAIGEGLETVLSAMQLGFSPAWALGDANNVRNFPVLSGLESLTIIVDNDESGTGQRAALECSSRWTSAGREVFRIIPDRRGEDINDVVRRAIV